MLVFLCSGKEREHNLQAGDNVEVCEGELINLQGKILSVDGNKITIMPKHEDLKVGRLPAPQPRPHPHPVPGLCSGPSGVSGSRAEEVLPHGRPCEGDRRALRG